MKIRMEKLIFSHLQVSTVRNDGAEEAEDHTLVLLIQEDANDEEIGEELKRFDVEDGDEMRK